MIDSILYAKMRPDLKISFSLAYFEIGTYEQVPDLLEKELELSSIENDGEFPILATTVAVTRENENKTDFFKTLCLYCETLGQLIEDWRKRIRKEQQQNQDSTQTVKGPMPKIYSLFVRFVKEQTIHQTIVRTVPTPPIHHRSTNNTRPPVETQKAPQKNTSPQDAPPSKKKNHLE